MLAVKTTNPRCTRRWTPSSRTTGKNDFAASKSVGTRRRRRATAARRSGARRLSCSRETARRRAVAQADGDWLVPESTLRRQGVPRCAVLHPEQVARGETLRAAVRDHWSHRESPALATGCDLPGGPVPGSRGQRGRELQHPPSYRPKPPEEQPHAQGRREEQTPACGPDDEYLAESSSVTDLWCNRPAHGVSWKAGEPATLVWMEALDGGDANVAAEHRDRFLSLAEPFEQPPHELLRTEHRRGWAS